MSVSRRAGQPRTAGTNWIKWGLGCAGISMLLVTGALMLGVIVGPAVFRNLSPADQDRLVRRLPFLSGLLPTNPAAAISPPVLPIPTGDALALLDTEAPTAPAELIPTPTPETPAAAPAQDASPPPTLLPTVRIPGTTPTPVPTSAAATIIAAALPPPTRAPAADRADTPPSATPALPPIPARARLGPALTWEPQRWNNCGPANLVQAMRYFGWRAPQVEVAASLKPTQDDKNVSPWEMVRYVNTQTSLRALTRYAGDLDLVRRLVAADFPVMLETGFYDPDEPEEGWIGHYQTIIGYDDASARLAVMDTLKQETSVLYAVMDELWSHFNRQYLLVYRPEREAEIAALLGPHMDEAHNFRYALDMAREAARQQPGSFFAWFNLGSSYVLLEQYAEAAEAYDQALRVAGAELPYRMLWYQFGPYEAYYHTGRFDQALELIEYTIRTSRGHVEEMFYWRGMVAAARGNVAAALADFDRALAYNQYFTPAAVARAQVQQGSFHPPRAASGG